jgi:hypothetical protein
LARFAGGATFASTVAVVGGATFASTTDHTGAARFAAGVTTSALDVNGLARFAGGATFASTVAVVGGATFASTDHTGAARFAAGVTTSALDVTGVARFAGGATFASTVAVVGGATFASTTDHTGAARFASTVAVVGGLSATALYASTGSTFASGVNIGLGTSGATLGISGGVHLYAQSQLRFADADSSNWVGFKSPATVANNVVWTLPGTTGSVNQVLQLYDGSGGLTWASLQAGVVGSDKQIQYNASGGLSASSAFVISNSLYGGGSIVSRGGGVNSFSTAFGCNALYGNSAGNYNTAIGYSAASNITFGDCNTAIGFMAGANESSDNAPNCNATRSIYIGACSKALDNGLCDEIVIGANAMGCGTFTTVIGSTAQTAATIYGVLNLPSGLSASALYASTGSTFASTVTVSGGATFASTTDHEGIARFGAGITTSALNVTGVARFAGGATFASTTDHTGAARFASTVAVAGGLSASALYASTGSTFASGVNIGLGTSGATLGISGGIYLYAQSQLRFADADSSNWVGFKSPATVANNVVWTLPGTIGSANQVLQLYDGSGGLTWASLQVAGSDKQIQYNASGGFSASDNFMLCNNSLIVGNRVRSNIAIGNNALYQSSTVGCENTGIGFETLRGSTGSFNLAVGFMAMYGSTGCANVGIGMRSLCNNKGNDNYSFGNSSGAYQTGSNNFSIGLLANSGNTGSFNYSIGCGAGENQTGSTNYSFGPSSMYGTSGSDNIAIGNAALALSSGSFNYAIGCFAMYSSTGSNNVAFGNRTLMSSTGSSNIGIGNCVISVAGNNQIVIGTNLTSAGACFITLGRNSFCIYNNGASNAWTYSSDCRIKKDIRDSELGLAFIESLCPKIFKWRAPSEYDEGTPGRDVGITYSPRGDSDVYGMLAQDVISAASQHSPSVPFAGFDNGGETRVHGLSVTAYELPIINAIKELSARVKILETRINMM